MRVVRNLNDPSLFKHSLDADGSTLDLGLKGEPRAFIADRTKLVRRMGASADDFAIPSLAFIQSVTDSRQTN